jgi:hypothetical protein
VIISFSKGALSRFYNILLDFLQVYKIPFGILLEMEQHWWFFGPSRLNQKWACVLQEKEDAL